MYGSTKLYAILAMQVHCKCVCYRLSLLPACSVCQAGCARLGACCMQTSSLLVSCLSITVTCNHYAGVPEADG